MMVPSWYHHGTMMVPYGTMMVPGVGRGFYRKGWGMPLRYSEEAEKMTRHGRLFEYCFLG
jgi:hypothetical protein